jgi:Ca-activated chloride channel family protein
MEEFLNNIHFLRAVWLWGLVPVGVIGLLLLLTTQQKENWRNAINKDILPFLIVRGDGISYLPKIMLLLVLTIMVISLAGPSWQKVEKPGGKIEAAMVVVVDASASMMAEDIGPSRMERTKQKIHDLLNASPGVHTSVVAFAGSAHLLIPFTNDYKAIDHQLKSLTPKVMPVGGSDLSLALELADSLLNRIEAPSTIVVFTDNITDKEIEVLKSRNDAQDRIELLAMATPGGAPIPVGRGRFLKDKSGQTVIPALDVDAVKRAAKIKSVNVSVITLDDSDVQRLASNIRQNMLYEKDPELQDEDWMDAGFWLVIPLSFIILFMVQAWVDCAMVPGIICRLFYSLHGP